MTKVNELESQHAETAHQSESIPVFRPLIDSEELEACRQALELRWLGMGKYVGEFETALKTFIEAPDRHVAAVSTGHAAIHLALLTMGVGEGDEVITPSFNNIADFQAILATGAQPVFCDIDDRTLCVDLEKAEQLVTPKTKAIIVMDYDCILCDHDAVRAFAERHGLRVLHDAAHSIGSRYKKKMVGSFSDVTMFSFDPVKTMTCIDGGALVVRSESELKAIHAMRLVGMEQPSSVMYQNKRAWTYDVKQLGFRYHMPNLHAALGLSQLAKMPIISRNRQEAALFYNAELSGIPEVRTPETNFEDITPFLYYIRVPANDRDALRDYLAGKGIDTGIHWQPGHWFSLLSHCKRGDLSVTEQVGHEILSLPLFTEISREMQTRVIREIRNFFKVR